MECRLENVRENDKLRKRQERARERVVRDKETQQIQRAKREAKEKFDQQRHEARQAELMKKEKSGDPLARMHIAKPQSKEYWEAYKQYEIEYAESWNRKSARTVNDISVYEPDFAEKVIITTKELGHVRTGMYEHI